MNLKIYNLNLNLNVCFEKTKQHMAHRVDEKLCQQLKMTFCLPVITVAIPNINTLAIYNKNKHFYVA